MLEKNNYITNQIISDGLEIIKDMTEFISVPSLTINQKYMHLDQAAIKTMNRIKRLNIINSITGIKPANLIGTISNEGVPNLAIFSSIVHLGSNPAIIGMITRPTQEVRRHTHENIQANGYYTINHIHPNFIQKAHFTSAKFEAEVSEFDACQLTEEYLYDFKAPFVQESRLKLGMQFLEEILIPINQTVLIIGEIKHLIIPDEVVSEEGYIDLAEVDAVGISGLNRYYALEKIGEFPYARVGDLPDFDNE